MGQAVRNVSPGFGAIIKGDGVGAMLRDDLLKLLSHLIHPSFAREGFEVAVGRAAFAPLEAARVVMLIRQLLAFDAYKSLRNTDYRGRP